MNAPPLLAELNAKIAEYQPGGEAHIINLSLLPQTEQDLAFLEQRLGKGLGDDIVPRLRQLPDHRYRHPIRLVGAVFQFPGHVDPQHAGSQRRAQRGLRFAGRHCRQRPALAGNLEGVFVSDAFFAGAYGGDASQLAAGNPAGM